MKCIQLVIVLLFLLYNPLFIYGQQSFHGRIIDENGFGIHGANIRIYAVHDTSHFLAGISNFEGYYKINLMTTDLIDVVQVDKDGYQAQKLMLKSTSDSLQIAPDIVLVRQIMVLDELIVVGRSNPIKLSPGKVSFDLKNSAFGTLGSALNALQKTSGVQILPNGKISLNGEEGVQVLIDGKTSFITGENLIAYLNTIPASSLAEIELISQPNAELDASGNARFINLKRNNEPSKGLNVIVSSNSEFGKLYRMNQNISFDVNRNKWQFSNVYAYSSGKDLTDIRSSRFLTIGSEHNSKPLQLDMDAERKKQYTNHYYKGQLDFIPNSRHRLGAYFLLNNTNRIKDESVNSLFYYHTIEPDSLLQSNNLWHHDLQNHAIGGQFTFQFKDDSRWENYVDRQLFKQDDRQQLYSNYLKNNLGVDHTEMRGTTNGNIHINSIQSKYHVKLLDQWKMTVGGKYTDIDIQTQSIYEDLKQNQWQENLNLANNFLHEEHLKALFLQTEFAITDKLYFDAGLRYENAAQESYSYTGDNSIRIARSYQDLFPNLSMVYTSTNQQKFSFLFNRRVNRPSFRDLNPFVEINDPYLYEKGNPALKPEFVHNLEFTWMFKRDYSLQVFYSVSQNPISKSYIQSTQNRTIVMPLNLSDAYRLGLRFNTVNLSLAKYWYLQANTTLIYKSFQWSSLAGLIHNRRLTVSGQLQNQFKLPLKISLDINASMSSLSAEGQADILPVWSINTGFRKTLLQDKFTLYIYGNDLFRSNRPRIHLSGDFIKGKYQEAYDTRAVGISLSYRLNRGLNKEQRKQTEINRLEENNRISY